MQQLLLLAATQYGIFSRAQAHEHGVTDRVLQRRVRGGVLEQLGPGVYRVEGAPPSWHQAVLGGCLGGGPTCVASHRTAAVLHGFDGFKPGVIELTVPRRVRYRRHDIVVHQSLDLTADDVTRIDAIPVTTAERALIDLGAVTGYERVEHAFDGAERDALADRGRVIDRHREVRRQGRNGVGPMAVVLDARPLAIPHSVLERAFARLLDAAGLPAPVFQHPVVLANGRRAFIDAAYVDLTLGFELDGHGSHATRQQRAADNRRANDLKDVGWDLRRFTYEEVMRDGARVVRTVRTAIAQRQGFGDDRRP
jgi:predicted transcriptional regulator of viral defense system/very-short-patch-repair endonuclease